MHMIRPYVQCVERPITRRTSLANCVLDCVSHLRTEGHRLIRPPTGLENLASLILWQLCHSEGLVGGINSAAPVPVEAVAVGGEG
jgi:hypothetical protein